MPLSDFWRFAWHSSHFQSLQPLPICSWWPSSCCPGVESQSRWVAYVLSLCGSFKLSFSKIWQFLALPQPPLLFTARSCGDSSSWHWNPQLCSLAWGWDRLLPRYPSRFLSTTRECGTAGAHSAAAAAAAAVSMPHCSSSPLRPPTHLYGCGCMKDSLNPWLSDFHTV